MPETTDNTTKLLNFISQKFENGEIDNNTLVQLIELAGMYLNIKTIPDYCKENKISYNGAKKFRNPIVIFGTKYIINNE